MDAEVQLFAVTESGSWLPVVRFNSSNPQTQSWYDEASTFGLTTEFYYKNTDPIQKVSQLLDSFIEVNSTMFLAILNMNLLQISVES